MVPLQVLFSGSFSQLSLYKNFGLLQQHLFQRLMELMVHTRSFKDVFLFRVFYVNVPDQVSLWYLPNRDRVCCIVPLFS
jgi:hypothetical protein